MMVSLAAEMVTGSVLAARSFESKKIGFRPCLYLDVQIGDGPLLVNKICFSWGAYQLLL